MQHTFYDYRLMCSLVEIRKNRLIFLFLLKNNYISKNVFTDCIKIHYHNYKIQFFFLPLNRKKNGCTKSIVQPIKLVHLFIFFIIDSNFTSKQESKNKKSTIIRSFLSLDISALWVIGFYWLTLTVSQTLGIYTIVCLVKVT